MTTIVTTHVRKHLGDKEVLNDIHLTVNPGEIHALIGASGSGKTTFMRTAMGLYRPDAGEVRVLGDIFGEKSKDARQFTAYVSEQSELIPWMTVADIVSLDARCRRASSTQDVESRLMGCGIRMAAKASALSKGMRKRVEWELAFAANPRAFLLDEPFDGLDPVWKAEIIERFISAVHEYKAGALISSHDISELERLCTHFSFLKNGRLVLTTSTEEFKTQIRVYRSEQVSRTIEDTPYITKRSTDAETLVVAKNTFGSNYNLLGFSETNASLSEVTVEILRGTSAPLEARR